MKNKHMEIAIIEAKKAYDMGEVPVGAAIFQGDQLIAAAHNLTQTTNKPTAHAEILAIEAACEKLSNWRLDGLSLYVTLEPCPMCASLIMLSRLKRVYFGAYDIKNGACGGFVDLFAQKLYDNKTQVYGGICEEECKALVTDFFQNLR